MAEWVVQPAGVLRFMTTKFLRQSTHREPAGVVDVARHYIRDIVYGANDGIIRWWVNGVLNGDYRNVPYPAIRGFVEFQHAPTLQNPPPAEQYMYIDHTHVSGR